MIIITDVTLRQILHNYILFFNGIAVGALLGIYIYRNITLKHDLTRRRWL